LKGSRWPIDIIKVITTVFVGRNNCNEGLNKRGGTTEDKQPLKLRDKRSNVIAWGRKKILVTSWWKSNPPTLMRNSSRPSCHGNFYVPRRVSWWRPQDQVNGPLRSAPFQQLEMFNYFYPINLGGRCLTGTAKNLKLLLSLLEPESLFIGSHRRSSNSDIATHPNALLFSGTAAIHSVLKVGFAIFCDPPSCQVEWSDCVARHKVL